MRKGLCVYACRPAAGKLSSRICGNFTWAHPSVRTCWPGTWCSPCQNRWIKNGNERSVENFSHIAVWAEARRQRKSWQCRQHSGTSLRDFSENFAQGGVANFTPHNETHLLSTKSHIHHIRADSSLHREHAVSLFLGQEAEEDWKIALHQMGRVLLLSPSHDLPGGKQ